MGELLRDLVPEFVGELVRELMPELILVRELVRESMPELILVRVGQRVICRVTRRVSETAQRAEPGRQSWSESW